MSGYLAGKVWHSGLEAELKPLAATLADIGDDDGTSIYPSIEFVAWRLSRSRSAVEVGLRKLRAMGILIPVELGGGRGKPTEYRLIEKKLPTREPWNETRKRITNPIDSTGFPQKNPIASNGVSAVNHVVCDEKPRCLEGKTTLPTTYETLGPVRREKIGAANPAAQPKRKSLPAPENFCLTPEMERFAKENRVADIRQEFEAFLDFHRSKASKFADWIAAWRTWVRNCQKFNPQRISQESLSEQAEKLTRKYGIS